MQLLFVLLCALLSVASAYNRPPSSKNFAEIDTDASGHATEEEVLAHIDSQFKKEVDAWFEFYDSNKDGKVHYDEYMALPKSNQQYWDSVDINKDQYTNFDEMKIGRDRKHPKRADTFINYYDSNSDGHIHKAEFNAKHEL